MTTLTLQNTHNAPVIVTLGDGTATWTVTIPQGEIRQAHALTVTLGSQTETPEIESVIQCSTNLRVLQMPDRNGEFLTYLGIWVTFFFIVFVWLSRSFMPRSLQQ
jgi:hypothetical protein